MDLGQMLYDWLAPLGYSGLLFCVFLLFYIDAIFFPTLPELFTIIIFAVYPTVEFAAAILLVIVVAEFLGLSTLYLIVKKVRVPHRIQDIVNRYTRFLMLQDERIILLNRIAPVLPFTGAFVAICNWSFKKAALYTFIGGVVKYGIILALSSIMYRYLSGNQATLVTLLLIIVIMAISFALSWRRRKRMLASSETARPGNGS